jgi:hypothetical protein
MSSALNGNQVLAPSVGFSLLASAPSLSQRVVVCYSIVMPVKTARIAKLIFMPDSGFLDQKYIKNHFNRNN